MSSITELVAAVAAKTGERLWVCDRTRGQNGHEVISGHDVTYYTLSGVGKGRKVVKIDNQFWGEVAPIHGQPFATMAQLEQVVKTEAKPVK